MLRATTLFCAPVLRSPESAPFARAMLMGRVSEARVDAYFFDQSCAAPRDAVADTSAYVARRETRAAALREAYGITGTNNSLGRSIGADVRPFAGINGTSSSATAIASETSAALSLVLDALVQHSKMTVEFDKYLADTEAVHQALSRLAATIYALDSAAMAVEALADGGDASAADQALLAIAARRFVERRVGDAVSLMNPSCVFAPDTAASMPARFKAVQHVVAGFQKAVCTSGATHPLAAPAVVAAIADAAKAATASPEANPVFGAVQGKRAFHEERAAREFPVNMYLKLPAIQLCDDVCAFRKAVVERRAVIAADAAATGAVAAVCSELFAATAALFRASSSVDVDDVAGYPDALKAQVFLEESRHARIADLALLGILGGNAGAKALSAASATSGGVKVTPPTELPAPKQAAPAAAAAPKKEQAAADASEKQQ